jgi:carboxymethylenebutenolidase
MVHRPLAAGHGRDAHHPHRGETQVVDEVMIDFTHDCEMPALLPGVKPTGRRVTIPVRGGGRLQGRQN